MSQLIMQVYFLNSAIGKADNNVSLEFFKVRAGCCRKNIGEYTECAIYLAHHVTSRIASEKGHHCGKEPYPLSVLIFPHNNKKEGKNACAAS